jgi:hypothetical protein
MFILEHSLETTASVDRIWALAQDVETWPRWQDGLQWARLQGPLVPGSQGRLRVRGGGERTLTILTLEPGRRLTWLVKGLFRQALVTQDLEASALGTRMTHRVEVRGPAAWLDPWFRRSTISVSLPESMRRLARMAAAAP